MAGYIITLFLFWMVSGSRIYAQDVIFDGSGDSTCVTKEGGSGRCLEIDKCPEIKATFLINPPSHCGFKGFLPVVCCPVKTEPVSEDPSNSAAPILNVSPPDFGPAFVCGKSAVKTFSISFLSRFKRAKPGFDLKHAVDQQQPTVVGGIDAKRNAWPWMALLGIVEANGNHDWFCGGALINDQWVLTAAHCLDTKKPQIVRLGEHDYSNENDEAFPEDYGIEQYVLHPDYTFPAAYHDLALLKLSRKVNLQTYISPVCLPWGKEGQKDLTGRNVKLTGWGDTEFFGNPSSILQEVDITMFPISECQQSYSQLRDFQKKFPKGMGNETACAGHRAGGRDACQGDSGGPIMYLSDGRYIQNGIVSTGYGCGNKDFPGIYANIQYPPHLFWIKKVAF